MKTPAQLKKPENTAVAVMEENLNQLPDFLDADLGKHIGLEELDNTDYQIPRIKLIQGLSPEHEQFATLKNGDFFHTAHETAIPQPFLAVPVYIQKKFILWRPRNMGGGILARADDAKHWVPADADFTVKLDKTQGGKTVTWHTKKTVLESGLADWGSMNPEDKNSQPAATLMYNLLLAFPNTDFTPAVLTLQRTSVKCAQKLHMKLRSTNRPIFQSVVRFTSFLDHTEENDFYNVQTELAGTICTMREWVAGQSPYVLGSKAFYEDCKNQYEGIKSLGLNIKDEEGLQSDAREAATSTDDGPAY